MSSNFLYSGSVQISLLPPPKPLVLRASEIELLKPHAQSKNNITQHSNNDIVFFIFSSPKTKFVPDGISAGLLRLSCEAPLEIYSRVLLPSKQ